MPVSTLGRLNNPRYRMKPAESSRSRVRDSAAAKTLEFSYKNVILKIVINITIL